ncbi:MAG: META domain-containing protein [Bacteroidia bacterium]
MKILFTICCFLLVLVSCKSTSKSTENNDKAEPSASLTDSKGWAWDNNKAYVIKFDEEGQFSLKLDVNNCFGRYKVDGSALSFPDGVACTEACCDGPKAMTLTQSLFKVTSHTISGNTLVLQGESVKLQFSLGSGE